MPKSTTISIGDRFGRLTVLALSHKKRYSDNNTANFWLCQCDCGKITKPIRTGVLKRGHSQSCGCLKREMLSQRNAKGLGTKKDFRKGSRNTTDPLYPAWSTMMHRCKAQLKHYQGINVCSDWHDFLSFRTWAIQSGYEPGLTIDRIDYTLDYFPENCRWVTQIEQANNRRDNVWLTMFGETKTLAQWSRDPRCKVKYSTLCLRVRTNRKVAESFTDCPASQSIDH